MQPAKQQIVNSKHGMHIELYEFFTSDNNTNLKMFINAPALKLMKQTE